MSKRCKPGQDEALIEYLALGQSRSLSKLHKHLHFKPKKWSAPPGVERLKKWSAKFGWRIRAEEHDAQVAGRTSEKAIEREAGDRASVFDGIQDAVLDLLAKLHDELKRVTIKTVEDLDRLADVIISLSVHGLDIQRGKQPDPDLVAALVREKLLGNGSTDRASAPPTADELGAAVDKAFKDYDGTKH